MLISIQQLGHQFQLKITGILHIGAHECEELNDYNKVGVPTDRTYWVEAMPDKVAFCRQRYGEGLHIYQAVIDERDDEKVSFNVTNNGQSSSILEFGSHSTSHPQVHVIGKMEMTTSRLDTLIEREKIPIASLNFVNLISFVGEDPPRDDLREFAVSLRLCFFIVSHDAAQPSCSLHVMPRQNAFWVCA